MKPPNFNDLKARAEGGDARAQYELAASLSASGARGEAEEWLKKAAEGGEPDAGYTLATQQLQTGAGAEEACRLARKAAANGSVVAQRLLAVLYAEGLGIAADWQQAVQHIIATAKAGDPASYRELAMLLLLHEGNDAAGMTLLSKAANKDPVAAAVHIRNAIANKNLLPNVKPLAQNLRRMRYPHAESLIAGLRDLKSATDAPTSQTIDWNELSDQLSHHPPENWTTTERAEVLTTEPDAKVFRNAFSPAVCEYVIATSSRHLAPSLTVDPRSGEARQDAYRTSLTATMGPVDLDLALVTINRRIAHLSRIPFDQGEFLSVLHYSSGQEYKPHFDWLPPGDDVEKMGQRVTTSLLYLNEDYEGGETHFLTPDIRFKGNAGDLLIFRNVDADGKPDDQARHASLPIISGAKWLASKWFRGKRHHF